MLSKFGFSFWLLLFLFLTAPTYSQSTKYFLEKGWSELVKDNDADALKYFSRAYEKATTENNHEDIAESLLNMGICTYSVSYSEGLDYAMRAMTEYKKLEHLSPQKALQALDQFQYRFQQVALQGLPVLCLVELSKP